MEPTCDSSNQVDGCRTQSLHRCKKQHGKIISDADQKHSQYALQRYTNHRDNFFSKSICTPPGHHITKHQTYTKTISDPHARMLLFANQLELYKNLNRFKWQSVSPRHLLRESGDVVLFPKYEIFTFAAVCVQTLTAAVVGTRIVDKMWSCGFRRIYIESVDEYHHKGYDGDAYLPSSTPSSHNCY